MNPLPVAAALGELVDPGLVHGQPARYTQLFADELRQIRKRDFWHAAHPPVDDLGRRLYGRCRGCFYRRLRVCAYPTSTSISSCTLWTVLPGIVSALS